MFEKLKESLKKESAQYSLISGIAYVGAIISFANYVSSLASNLYFDRLPGEDIFDDLCLLCTVVSTLVGKIFDGHSKVAANKELIRELYA